MGDALIELFNGADQCAELGGQGYFDFLLKDGRFQKQKASFFCLENSNWKIFGLDSSHEDGGLRDPQADSTNAIESRNMTSAWSCVRASFCYAHQGKLRERVDRIIERLPSLADPFVP